MAKKLWEASKDQKLNSNLHDYKKFISNKFNLKLVKIIKIFLTGALIILEIFGAPSGITVRLKDLRVIKKLKISKIFYKNIFLPKSKLNFAENLLVKNN